MYDGYTIEAARNFAFLAQSYTKPSDFDVFELRKALWISAQACDRETFKKIMNAHARCAANTRAKNPLSKDNFLDGEYMCAAADHNFGVVPYARSKGYPISQPLAPGPAQIMLSDIYGFKPKQFCM